jgi:hypothetical protein
MSLSAAEKKATEGPINFVHKATGYRVASGLSRAAAEELARRVKGLGADSDVVELAADGDTGAQKLLADMAEDARRDVARKSPKPEGPEPEEHRGQRGQAKREEKRSGSGSSLPPSPGLSPLRVPSESALPSGIVETGDATGSKVRLPRGPVFPHKCQGDMCQDVSHRRIHTLAKHIEHLQALASASPAEEASARALDVFAELQAAAERAVTAAKLAQKLDDKASKARDELEKKLAKRLAHDPQRIAMEQAFAEAEAKAKAGDRQAAKAAATIADAIEERAADSVRAVQEEAPDLYHLATKGAEEAAQAAATAQASLAHVEALKAELDAEKKKASERRLGLLDELIQRAKEARGDKKSVVVMAGRAPLTPVKVRETITLREVRPSSIEGDFAVVSL